MKRLSLDRNGRSLLLPFAFLGLFLSVHGADVENCNRDTVTENFDTVEKLLKRAELAGAKLIFGQEEFDEKKHFLPFGLDATVYNVIYERRYLDKKGSEKAQQFAIYPDRLTLTKFDRNTERNGARMSYALAGANKEKNVVVASKQILPPAGDTLNICAMIIVIVYAPWPDKHFDNARNLQRPEPVKEAGR